MHVHENHNPWQLVRPMPLNNFSKPQVSNVYADTFLQLIWNLVSFQFTNRTSLNQQLSEVASMAHPMKRSVPARTSDLRGSTYPLV
jgi:hypothetical protein